MKKTKPEQKKQSAGATTDTPPWARPRTLSVQAKADTTPLSGYPVARVYHPPTEADRMAEEPERWDGLS